MKLFALLFAVVSCAFALGTAPHCGYKKLQTLIVNGGSVSQVDEMWQTLMFAYPLSAHEKRALGMHAVTCAQEQLEICQQTRDQVTATQIYGDYALYGVTLAASVYAMGVVAGAYFRQVSLTLSHAWYCFPIAKFVSVYHQGIGSALATLQLVAGCTLAPYGAWWAAHRIWQGPARVALVTQRMKELETIIAYLEAVSAE